MADIREEARAELESIVQAEDERWDGSRSAVDFSIQVADAILAAGYRKVEVTEEMVERAARAIQGAVEAGTPWESTTERVRTESRYEAHCALVAALGGEQS